MKLRNRKTGEIVNAVNMTVSTPCEPVLGYEASGQIGEYASLAELNEEWEDYEEPKTFYNILSNGGVIEKEGATDDMREEFIKDAKEIGNYFLSREEAERAVEKLKAWKRLKDKGFRFNGVEVFSEGLLEIDGVLPALKGADDAERLKIVDDLHLLCGEEEE